MHHIELYITFSIFSDLILRKGDFNDLTLLGTLAGVEMGLGLAGVPHNKGGVQAAMDFLGK